jgi:hypothetical protein
LPANFDGCGYIENGVFARTLRCFLNKLGDLLWLFGLNIAVKKKGCVILVIVGEGIQISLVSL